MDKQLLHNLALLIVLASNTGSILSLEICYPLLFFGLIHHLLQGADIGRNVSFLLEGCGKNVGFGRALLSGIVIIVKFKGSCRKTTAVTVFRQDNGMSHVGSLGGVRCQTFGIVGILDPHHFQIRQGIRLLPKGTIAHLGRSKGLTRHPDHRTIGRIPIGRQGRHGTAHTLARKDDIAKRILIHVLVQTAKDASFQFHVRLLDRGINLALGIADIRVQGLEGVVFGVALFEKVRLAGLFGSGAAKDNHYLHLPFQ